MNPSSQLKIILFGKVVRDPTDDPFLETVSGPQSLAKDSGKGNHSAHRQKIIESSYLHVYFVSKTAGLRVL